MDLVRRETDRSTAPEFVTLDIRGEAESPEANPELVMKVMETSFPGNGKGLERERNGDANPSSTGMEKQALPVHVDGSPREQFHPSTPTAGNAKRRRAGRRVPGWRDPRKILFAFAALSSVGTLILLYFTLSMGKMVSSQADGE